MDNAFFALRTGVALAGIPPASCLNRLDHMQQMSSRLRDDADRAERLAELAVNDTLRQEQLEIAAEFRAKSKAWQKIEQKRWLCEPYR